MTLPDITQAKKQLVSLLDSAGGTITGEELVNRMLEHTREVILAADGNAASAVAQTLMFVNANQYPVLLSRATLRCESNVAGDATNIGTINLAVDDGAGGAKTNYATINTLNTNYVAGVGQTFTITPTSGGGTILVPAGAGVYYQQTKGSSGVAFPIRALTVITRKA